MIYKPIKIDCAVIPSDMFHRAHRHISQRGTVLLIFILILITGTSYLLLVRLNATEKHHYMRQRQNLDALQRAKQALIGYAVIYPEKGDPDPGPGYLPCPDKDGKGEALGSCSADGRTTIGWFPFKTLETAELRDSSGAKLWYAVSDHHKSNPKLQPLNSETPGQLSLDSQDDIVAVIIAPGAPLTAQDRKPIDNRDTSDKEIIHYLEQENSYLGDDDTKYARFVSIGQKDRDELNDHILAITRTELMKAIEKRVLAEVRQALIQYKEKYDAYPWLSPFADPKAEVRQDDEGILSGCLSNGTLTDTKEQDDRMTLLVDDCDFEKKDNNKVRVIAAGDVLDITKKDGSTIPAIIYSVPKKGLVIRPTDSTSKPEAGNSYRIRRNYGKINEEIDVTDPTLLRDPGARFETKGIRSGDTVIIKKEIDGDSDADDTVKSKEDVSFGRVSAVTGEDQLIVNILYPGNKNQFSPGDRYILPRFNAAAEEYRGQLAIHRSGAAFFSPFDVAWTITDLVETEIQSVEDIFPTERHSFYINNLKTLLQAPTSIHIAMGFCTWGGGPSYVDCIGLSEPEATKIDGSITADIKNSTTIEDKNAAFRGNHIKRGDIVLNYDDSTTIAGGKIQAGSRSTATDGSEAFKLVDHSNDFILLDIKPGHKIYNKTDGSRGTVASVIDKNTLIATLTAGTNNAFSDGDEYQVLDTPRLFFREEINLIKLGVKPDQYMVTNDTAKIRSVISTVHNKRLLSTRRRSPDGKEARFSPGDTFSIQRAMTAVVTKVSSEHELETGPVSDTSPDFDCGIGTSEGGCQEGEGERYRIIAAAATLEGRITTPCSACIDDPGAQFISNGIQVGDIVENRTDSSFGRISAINENKLETQLYGGSNNAFNINDQYHIYYDYGYYRGYRIKVKYQGTPSCPNGREQRVRTVCTTEDPLENKACTDKPCSPTAIPLSDELIKVDVIDYEEDQKTPVAGVRFLSTESKGKLETADIRYYMDLPGWFIKNDWHRLIYIAYNLGHLQLRGTAVPDKDVIVIAGGAATGAQDRASGREKDYFESIADSFEKEKKDNDQVVTIPD